MLAQLHAKVDAWWHNLVKVLGQGAHAALSGEVLGHGDVEELFEDTDQLERDVTSFPLLAPSKTNEGAARLGVELCTKLHCCHLVSSTHEAENGTEEWMIQSR